MEVEKLYFHLVSTCVMLLLLDFILRENRVPGGSNEVKGRQARGREFDWKHR